MIFIQLSSWFFRPTFRTYDHFFFKEIGFTFKYLVSTTPPKLIASICQFYNFVDKSENLTEGPLNVGLDGTFDFWLWWWVSAFGCLWWRRSRGPKNLIEGTLAKQYANFWVIPCIYYLLSIWVESLQSSQKLLFSLSFILLNHFH